MKKSGDARKQDRIERNMQANENVRLIAEALEGTGFQVVEVEPMVVVLGLVARRRGMSRSDGDAWVDAVQAKLVDVGVLGLRQFVINAVRLNAMLVARGHRALHGTTLRMMLEEVCDMVMGPEEPNEMGPEEPNEMADGMAEGNQ